MPSAFVPAFAKSCLNRRALLYSRAVTAYRLFDGVGDGIAGIYIDRYGPAVVVNVYDDARWDDQQITHAANTILESLNANGVESVYVKRFSKDRSRLGGKAPEESTSPKPRAGVEQAPVLTVEEYGARFEITESLGGMHEAVAAAQQMATRDDVFLPDQFSNPANPEAHRRSTGPELWQELDGEIDVFVAGVGTGGTITGVGEYLKERNPKLHIVAVEPASSPVLSGGRPGPHRIQGIGAGFVPKVLNREIIDEVLPIGDDDAVQAARLLAAREGVLAGISAGAAVAAALQLAARPEFARSRIATVLPDSGERYISLPWFGPESR